MMALTLVCDPTGKESVLLGMQEGKNVFAERIMLSYGRRIALAEHIESFLHRQKRSIGNVTALAIVNGPGRFSGLRMASVMANLFRWDRGVLLFTARCRQEQIASPVAAVQDILKRAKPVRQVLPWYGRRAHITKQKRRKE